MVQSIRYSVLFCESYLASIMLFGIHSLLPFSI